MSKSGPKKRTVRNSRPRSASAGPSWRCPSHLDAEEREAWHHVAAMIAAAGNLERSDPTLAEVYAINVGLLREARASVAKDGAVFLGRFGTPAVNPACDVINAATIRIKAIIETLGLCPATSKYAADKSNDAKTGEGDKWAGLLGVAG